MRTQEHPDGVGTFEEFARSQGDRLYRCAFVLCGDAETAQDLVQSVFCKLISHGIDDLDDPFVYARRCLVNEYRSLWRRATTRRNSTQSTVAPEPVPDHAGATALRQDTSTALQRLSPRQRAAVVMRYYEDMGDREIAAVLGCAPATVRSLLSRSVATLRRHLGDDTERSGHSE